MVATIAIVRIDDDIATVVWRIAYKSPLNADGVFACGSRVFSDDDCISRFTIFHNELATGLRCHAGPSTAAKDRLVVVGDHVEHASHTSPCEDGGGEADKDVNLDLVLARIKTNTQWIGRFVTQDQKFADF